MTCFNDFETARYMQFMLHRVRWRQIFQWKREWLRARRLAPPANGNRDIESCRVSATTGFFNWWLGELRAMLPAVRVQSRAGARLPVISLDGYGQASVLDVRGRQAGPYGTLSEAIAELKGRRVKVVCVRVRPGDCLIRRVELPAAAQRNFEQMLRLDLERSTPLKSRDVLSAHIVEGPVAGGNLAVVRHLVVKRRTVEPALAALRDAGIEAAAIDCWDEEGSAALPVDFLHQDGVPERGGAGSVGRWAAVAAALLLVAVYLAQVWRQERAIAALDAEIAKLQESVREARRRSDDARAAGAFAEQLGRLKAERLTATQVLEEVTRLLPDTAWLQEFRLDNDTVEMAGLAASASALLPLFERSRHFHETSFTAPVRVEPGDERERFRLRTRLKAVAAIPGGTEAGR